MISVMTENQPNTAKLRIPKMDPRTFLFFNALSEEKIARMATNAKIITVPIRHYPLCLMFFERKCDALKLKRSHTMSEYVKQIEHTSTIL